VKIQLLPLTADLLAAMGEDPAAALRGLATVPPGSSDFLKLVATMSRDFYLRVGAQPPWTGYLGVDQDTAEVVGTCGFKGNPNAAGEVEIAYGTMKPFEGRGVATAMAQQLTAIALHEPSVRFAIAHTLPEGKASGRVLAKSGYKLVGEVIDPEDGKVWRWARTT
jgi:[ribosomal protein S5]-alanine N-acetyltransferase